MPPSIKKHWRNARLFVLLLVPLTVVPILAGWVGDIAKDYFGGATLSKADPWLFGAGLVGILILAIWIMLAGRKLFPAKVIEETPGIAPRRVVIALLSPRRNLVPPAAGEDPSAWRVRDSHQQGAESPLTRLSLEQAIDPARKLPQWSWQQTLRAAHHHRAALEQLVLIGSIDGSGKELGLAQRFFAQYFPDKVHIFGSPGDGGGTYDTHWQADFEKLDDLTRLLVRVLEELRRPPFSYTDQDLIIDCTGGFKIASIACALVTLDRPDLMFQYVGTGARTGKLLGFNVVTETRAD